MQPKIQKLVNITSFLLNPIFAPANLHFGCIKSFYEAEVKKYVILPSKSKIGLKLFQGFCTYKIMEKNISIKTYFGMENLVETWTNFDHFWCHNAPLLPINEGHEYKVATELKLNLIQLFFRQNWLPA